MIYGWPIKVPLVRASNGLQSASFMLQLYDQPAVLVVSGNVPIELHRAFARYTKV